MYKKVFIFALLLILVIGGIVQAGEIKVNVEQNEKSEKSDVKDVKTDYDLEYEELNFNNFKANGGPVLGAIQFDLNQLNEIIETENFSPFSKNMVFFGSKGIIGSKKGSRLGFFDMEGSLKSVNTENEIYKKAILEMKYGGMLYERGIYVNSKTNTDISFSSMIGSGNMNLDLYYDKADSSFEGQINQASSNHFTKKFFLIAPGVTLHQKISSLVGLDLSLKYMLSYDFDKTWISQGQSLTGPMNDFYAPVLNLQMSFGF